MTRSLADSRGYIVLCHFQIFLDGKLDAAMRSAKVLMDSELLRGVLLTVKSHPAVRQAAVFYAETLVPLAVELKHNGALAGAVGVAVGAVVVTVVRWMVAGDGGGDVVKPQKMAGIVIEG